MLVNLLWVNATIASAIGEVPSIRLNNYVIDFGDDQKNEIIDGEVFIPLRKIGEFCRYEILWEDNFAVIKTML